MSGDDNFEQWRIRPAGQEIDLSEREQMLAEIEMLRAECRVLVRQNGEWQRQVEVLRSKQPCPHIRSSGPPDRATNWCALAATQQPAPDALQRLADADRELGVDYAQTKEPEA